MSAGIPTIVHDVTATPEIVEDAALKIDTMKIKDLDGNEKDYTYYFHHGDRELARPIPDLNSMIDNMNKLYYDKNLRKKYSKLGRERMLSGQFSWDKLANTIDNAIEETLNKEVQFDLDLQEIL